ncbi:MAG: hypothetical protein IPK99_04450 [Flavobacteriales bacterium]|nr:hypothetical protein [Flavobacteriales bacterium]
MLKRAQWMLLPLWLGPIGVLAQALRFQHITTNEGLSHNAITCVFEDREGYIWIGTENGLNRYDGQRVERFTAIPNAPGIHHITSIDQAPSGDLWITTQGAGLFRRDHASGAFDHMQHDPAETEGLPSDKLNHVLVVNDSILVLSTSNIGACWFNTRAKSFTVRGFRYVRTAAGMDSLTGATWCHRALLLDPQHIWMPVVHSTRSYIADAITGELRMSLAFSQMMGRGPVTNGLVLGDRLYAGGWSAGIERLDLDRPNAPEFIPLADEVTAMVPWGDSVFIAGTKLNGLALIHVRDGEMARWRHMRKDHASLINDRVRCLLKDRNGTLWVGTADGLSVHASDVWHFAPTKLLADDVPGDLVFHNLQQDANGTIRISTSRGFFLVDPQLNTVRHVPITYDDEALEVTGLFEVGPNSRFIGTETGLYRYDPHEEHIIDQAKTDAAVAFKANVMFQVRSVFLDTLDYGPLLVVGALGYGHIAFDPHTAAHPKTWNPYPEGARTPLMHRTAVEDGHGAYWVGASDGLWYWKPARSGSTSELVQYQTGATGPRQLPGNYVTAIVISGDTVWCAMRDAGLACTVAGRAIAFTPPAHIPNDALGLTRDEQGRLWYCTSEGLVRFDPRTREWLHVPVNDGHELRRLNSSILTLNDGRIAFCTDRHLVTFDPTVFDALPALPVPGLMELKNTWGPLPVHARTVEIPYRSSAFDAVFSALSPTGAGPLEFVYRLEGVDSEARVTTAREGIRYSGVPVGTYRLLVRVRDAYGRTGPEHALLTVTVTGPFWQRWWFFVLVLGAGALGMYAISRLRQRQRLKLQGVRDRIARDLHDDIGSTLGSISYYSEALKRKLEHAEDDMAQQVAEKIGTSSRAMIEQMSDIVWSVDPKNDDAASLIERMRGFGGDLLSTRGIVLHFNAAPGLGERKLSAEQRRNIFLIYKEALHNAAKYAQCTSITVSIATKGRELLISIRDDGKGFDPTNVDSYNGNGLGNMRTRANMIGARVDVLSAPGQGTDVRVVAPLTETLPLSGD